MMLARSETQLGCCVANLWSFTIRCKNGSQVDTIEFDTLFVAGVIHSALLFPELASIVLTSRLGLTKLPSCAFWQLINDSSSSLVRFGSVSLSVEILRVYFFLKISYSFICAL